MLHDLWLRGAWQCLWGYTESRLEDHQDMKVF